MEINFLICDIFCWNNCDLNGKCKSKVAGLDYFNRYLNMLNFFQKKIECFQKSQWNKLRKLIIFLRLLILDFEKRNTFYQNDLLDASAHPSRVCCTGSCKSTVLDYKPMYLIQVLSVPVITKQRRAETAATKKFMCS